MPVQPWSDRCGKGAPSRLRDPATWPPPVPHPPRSAGGAAAPTGGFKAEFAKILKGFQDKLSEFPAEYKFGSQFDIKKISGNKDFETSEYKNNNVQKMVAMRSGAEGINEEEKRKTQFESIARLENDLTNIVNLIQSFCEDARIVSVSKKIDAFGEAYGQLASLIRKETDYLGGLNVTSEDGEVSLTSKADAVRRWAAIREAADKASNLMNGLPNKEELLYCKKQKSAMLEAWTRFGTMLRAVDGNTDHIISQQRQGNAGGKAKPASPPVQH